MSFAVVSNSRHTGFTARPQSGVAGWVGRAARQRLVRDYGECSLLLSAASRRSGKALIPQGTSAKSALLGICQSTLAAYFILHQWTIAKPKCSLRNTEHTDVLSPPYVLKIHLSIKENRRRAGVF